MQQTFQAGVDAIYNAIAAQGVTPASKNPADIANAVGTVATNRYNQGVATAPSALTVRLGGEVYIRAAGTDYYPNITASVDGYSGAASYTQKGGSGTSNYADTRFYPNTAATVYKR